MINVDEHEHVPDEPRRETRERAPIGGDKMKRAIAWVESPSTPVAVQRDAGHRRAFEVACKLVHSFGLSDSEAERVLVEYFNPRCSPPWDDGELHDLTRKVSEAREKGDPAKWPPIEDREPRAKQRTPNDAIPSADYEPPLVARVSVLVADVARLETPPIRSYSTGNPALDDLIGGGVNTRELAVVMGPPGGCKTAWAVSTTIYLSSTLPMLYASTELEQHELMARIAANLVERSWAAIRRGTVTRDRYLPALDGMRVRLLGCEVLPRDGDAALTMIEQEAVAMTEEYGIPPGIVLDYLQDLARGSERDLRSRVGDLATRCRAISQRLDCPMIAVSSVSRTFYSARRAGELRDADDPTIYLAAAKESGDVDYAAARVLFLDAEDDREKPERAVRIAVAKSRDGRVGFAGARVIAECGKFLTAPEVLSEMATSGRTEKGTTSKVEGAREKVYRTVVRMHAEGRRKDATYSAIKAESGINASGVRPALDALIHAGKLAVATIERLEGATMKRREIYDPTGGTGAE